MAAQATVGEDRRSPGLTHDVVHAQRAGAMLQEPGVHADLVELVGTRDDPQVLRERTQSH